MISLEQATELFYDARYLQDSDPRKRELLHQALPVFDNHQHDDLSLECRIALMDAETFSGHVEVLFTLFPWILAKYDEDPTIYPARTILWRYKWVLGNSLSFPQIRREQVEDLLDDFARRLDAQGYSKRTAIYYRWDVAKALGDLDRAAEHYQAYKQMQRDSMSDCFACERSEDVMYLNTAGRYEDAAEAALAMLEARLTCGEEPHRVLGHALQPLVLTGLLEEARDCHQRGYRMIQRNPSFLATAGQHIWYLALTDNARRGATLFERHLPWAQDSQMPKRKLTFYRASHLLFQRLEQQYSRSTIKLRLPKKTPIFAEDGSYTFAALNEWLGGTCKQLADRFDERNGNDSCSRWVQQINDLIDREPIPYHPDQ